MTIPQAMCDAAGELQRISEVNAGPRGQRAAAVALVLRTFERPLHGLAPSAFSLRRAAAEVARMESGTERALLSRLLQLEGSLDDPESLDATVELLVDYAYELELTRRLP